MKNLFIVLVLLAAAVFGGKLFIENRYEKELDKAIAMAAPFADMRYDRVELGYDGSLSLHGFSVLPSDSDEPVNVGKITFTSSDRFLAIKGKKAFENNQLPDAFSVQIDNVEFSSRLAQVFPEKEHCRKFNSTFVYSEIGLDRIEADMTMSFDFRDPFNAELDMYYSDDIGFADIRSVFDADAVPAMATGVEEAPFKEISLNTELNEEVATAINEYCADRFEISSEDFLAKVIGSPKYSENSFGADLGPQFREALIKYMKGGSQISLQSRPSKQLQKFSNAKFFKPRDVVRWLNLTITADGTTIPIEVAELEEEKKNEGGEKGKSKGAYTQVLIAEARNYLDSNVRISRTKDRTAIKGRLLGIKGDIMSVEIYRYTGVMTYKVPLSDVAKLEVYQ